MTVIHIICIVCVLVMLATIIRLCKMNRELYEEKAQDRAYLATLSEFVIHTKAHSDNETVTNDMINSIKTCVNKGLYEVTPVDKNYTDYTQDIAYRSLAEQMFKFVEEMDKE